MESTNQEFVYAHEDNREEAGRRFEEAMKLTLQALEPIIQHNREHLAYGNAKGWFQIMGDDAEGQARNNAIVALVGRFIQWYPKDAMRLAGDILEDVNLHELCGKVRELIENYRNRLDPQTAWLQNKE